MSKKHESIDDENLIYCFVYLFDINELPKFFLVTSNFVAKYVKNQHEKWLATRPDPKKSDTNMRKFRIKVSENEDFENNWDIFN